MLTSETVECKIYRADETIIFGRTLDNLTSRYGLSENEIPEVVDNLSIHEWLKEKSKDEKLNFISPYDCLESLLFDLDNLTYSLEKRIDLQSDGESENLL